MLGLRGDQGFIWGFTAFNRSVRQQNRDLLKAECHLGKVSSLMLTLIGKQGLIRVPWGPGLQKTHL